ncbi:putative Diguanylate cyclase [Candidatus Terasakiella magnetica]|uniref:Putative Diguanylate cyclase n=1 Tax=Candidatus Terasakiella magnetica TaxID=1867952 RepID=A0A1C3RJP0_9PROT|nr:diguanylate cyclase [Candidatus Terasakiella magnetica]SCA57447.1 putative Diguanylate cyclase [Candidatus Terasakiella magnetica]
MNQSIQRIFVTLGFITLSVIIISFVVNDFLNYRHKIAETVRLNGALIEKATDQYFITYKKIFSALREHRCVLTKETDACSNLFNRLNETYPFIENFAAVDKSGLFFASGQKFNREKPPSISHLPFFQLLKQGQLHYVMDPHIGPISKEHVTGLVIPILKEGRFDGLLGASIRTQEIQQVWREVTIASWNGVGIVNRKGDVIFQSSESLQGQLLEIAKFLQGEDITKGPSRSFVTNRGASLELYGLESAVSGWKVISFYSRDDLLSGYLEENSWVLVVLIPALALLITSLLLFSKYQEAASSRMHLVSQLQYSEQRFRDFANAASDWFWETDNEHILSFTSAVEEGSERNLSLPEETVGKSLKDLAWKIEKDDDKESFGNVIRKREPFRNIEFKVEDKNGKTHYWTASGGPMFDSNQKFQGYRGIADDITKAKDAQKKIEFLANHDALTGLPSLRLGMDRLQHDIALAKRNKTFVCVLFIDLDGFKAVNDTLGHKAGDQVLKEIAGRLNQCVRETDTVARIGGDEFLVILPNLNAPENAYDVAQAIVEQAAREIHHGEKTAQVGASVGIAVYPDDGVDPEELIHNADEAMYKVKHSGKSNFSMASNS